MSIKTTRISLSHSDVNGHKAEHVNPLADTEFALITLNRPEAMNPLDHDTIKALRAEFARLNLDDRARVVGITGAGKAFSAGGDMKKYVELQRDPVGFPAFLADLHALLAEMGAARTPVLGLINGVAVAGGLEILLGCDFAIAAESALIGDAHLPYGQMGGGGALTLLPRVVGPTRARELVFSGRLLPAHEAREWGLVSQVVPDATLIDAGVRVATRLAGFSPLAVGHAKQTLNAQLWEGNTALAGLRLERDVASRYCLTSDDSQEGLDAFANKRRPTFTGR